MPKDQVLYYAAHAESTSTHPIAKSIVEAYKGVIDSTNVISLESPNNRGIHVRVNDKEVIIGRKEFWNN